MAWTAYMSYTVGAILTAAQMNTYVRDNGQVLSYPGLVMWDSGSSTARSGWLACDGTAVSRTTYSALNSVYSGVTYPWGNGDGSTTFNTPDGKGRTLIGIDAASARVASFTTLGSAGGVGTVALVTAELAAHTHTHTHQLKAYSDANVAGVASTYVHFNTNDDDSGLANVGADGTYVQSNAQSTGSGTAHTNIQPSIAGLWVVKW